MFGETTLLFGKTSEFGGAFPTIESLQIDVEEEGEGVSASTASTTYTMRTLPGEYVDCRNPLCYKGGFNLGAILRTMVERRQEDLQTIEHCQGYEGSPKGRRNDGPCDNRLKVRIRLRFKPGGGKAEPQAVESSDQ